MAEAHNDMLFDPGEWWEPYWAGMPEFVQRDAPPVHSVEVSFRTAEDTKQFERAIGYGLYETRDYIYFPKMEWLRTTHQRYVADPHLLPRYPIYVISKGRWDHTARLTSRALEEMGAPYRIVVEPQEYDAYASVIRPEKILTLPFSNLGLGSIPARNWVWDHAVKTGTRRHWILDDNIRSFYRLNRNQKIRLGDPTGFRVAEDFVDRFENVALAGFQYEMFAPRRSAHPPFYLNTRIYSCILIDNSIPYRWRGRYNEDTDLSLRALKDSWCTVLFVAFLADKAKTMLLKGGNTDQLYAGDGRLRMAESLVEQHPDVATITWKWGRWQHQVNYEPFRANALRVKAGAEVPPGADEYGMRVIQLSDAANSNTPEAADGGAAARRSADAVQPGGTTEAGVAGECGSGPDDLRSLRPEGGHGGVLEADRPEDHVRDEGDLVSAPGPDLRPDPAAGPAAATGTDGAERGPAGGPAGGGGGADGNLRPEPPQAELFETGERWEEYWCGMPEFIQEDLAPLKTIQVLFRADHDAERFSEIVGQKVYGNGRYIPSIWFPQAEIGRMVGRRWRNLDPNAPHNPRYPVYIISKGRWESRLTAIALDRISVPYRIVVEPQEWHRYAEVIDESKILCAPENFSKRGCGSIPVRNFVWNHSVESGAARHWILDDNIRGFFRLNRNLKLAVADGTIFYAAEEFADRYENVALAGFHYFMFASRKTKMPPLYLNHRIYSCILISNDVPFRWRGRYNEDTDLSLRCLKAGYATALFNAFLALKETTMTMKGGNMEQLYAAEDGRLKMAQSLVEQHPDVTTIAWKWGRWQHQVDYRPFARNALRLRRGVTIPEGEDNFGMELEYGNFDHYGAPRPEAEQAEPVEVTA